MNDKRWTSGYETTTLPAIRAEKRRNCLTWLLVALVVILFIVAIAAIVWVLFIWKG